VDLLAPDCRVDHLGAPDVVLVCDLETLGRQCLAVELAEDELLGKVLRPDHEMRLGLRLLRSGNTALRRATEGGNADEKRNPQRDRERRLCSAARVLPIHLSSSPLRSCPSRVPSQPGPYALGAILRQAARCKGPHTPPVSSPIAP